MYPTNGGQPTAAIGDVAQKLDARILQLSADANRSPVAKVGSAVQLRWFKWNGAALLPSRSKITYYQMAQTLILRGNTIGILLAGKE